MALNVVKRPLEDDPFKQIDKWRIYIEAVLKGLGTSDHARLHALSSVLDHSGQLADTQVKASNVTQHEGAITHDNLLNLNAGGHDSRYYTETELSATTTGGTSGCSKIGIPAIGTPTWTNQCQKSNLFSSAGRATGGEISESGGVITIAAGTGFIKATDDDTAEVLSFDWVQETGFSVAADTIKYFGIEYNGGSPQVMETTDEADFDLDTSFPLGQVINQAGEYYVLNNPWWVTDGITNIIERFGSFGHLQRDAEVGGLVAGYSGVRFLTMSAGRIWGRLTEHEIPAFTSVGSVADFDMYYRDSSTTWAESVLYQWNNTQYNRLSDYTLQTIPNNQYTVIWIWVNVSSKKPSLIFPQQYYPSSAGAEAEAIPEFPAMWYKGGIIIGRFICKQGVDDPVLVQSVFDSTFTATLAANHGNLAGLTDDDHTQYLPTDGSRPLTGKLDCDGNDIQDIGDLNLDTATELTIASGVITVTQANHVVDTESDAASDDLDTINGGTDGDVIILSPASGSRTVTLKHGTGNIQCSGAADYDLDSLVKVIMLKFDGTNWYMVTTPGPTGPAGSGETYVDRGDPSAWDWQETGSKAVLNTDGNWHDLDLSSIISDSGVRTVHMLTYVKDDVVGSYFIVREKGNSNAYNRQSNITQAANIGNEESYIVSCNASQVVEYLASNVSFSEISILVRGWWT